MTITVTAKEYDAIDNMLEQVRSDYEAATDQDYINFMRYRIVLVQNVLNKYRAAKRKALEFQQVRAYVASRNSNKRLTAREIDKLARKLYKKLKNNNYE